MSHKQTCLRAVLFLSLLATLWSRAADDLSLLSDEFDDSSTLSNWLRVYQTEGWGFDQLAAWDINSSRPGRMFMQPHASSWYQEWRGMQAYKAVTGDFVVTTDVISTRRGGGGPPRSLFSLAGILVRTPRAIRNGQADWTAGGENYVFLSLGAADTAGAYQLEVKTTLNSSSVLEISPAAAGRARVQIARLGPYLITLRQFEGGTWAVHRRYTRADMPETLHAGLTAYTDWNTCSLVGYPFHNLNLLTNGLALPGGGLLATNPDLDAAFDYVRYRRPAVPAHLIGRNFANPAQVSDADLLSFLGANANTPGGSSTPVRIRSPRFQAGAAFSMTLELEVNRSYTVQRASSMPPSHWINLTNFVSTQSLVPYRDESAPHDSIRIYRVASP